MSIPKYGWHFVGATLRDGRPVPADGVWLEEKAPLVLCAAGLHASADPFDALTYAPGSTLCRVVLGGEIIVGDDKLVASRRKIIKRRDVDKMLMRFACDCALDVAHLWDMPPVVKEYLTTMNPELRSAASDAATYAARYAASDVASDAARAAVWAARYAATYVASDVASDAATYAARYADCAAASDAQRKRFNQMVRREFR